MNKHTSGPLASFGQAHVQELSADDLLLLQLWRAKKLKNHTATWGQLLDLGLTPKRVLLSLRVIDGVEFQLWRRTTIRKKKLWTRVAIISEEKLLISIDLSYQVSKRTFRFVFKAAKYREALLNLPLLGAELRKSRLFESIADGSNVVFARFVMAFFSGVDFYFDEGVDWNDRLVVDHLEKTIPGTAIDDFAFDLADKRNKLQIVTQEENLRRDQERAREIERVELEAFEHACVREVVAQSSSNAALASKYPNSVQSPALTAQILAQLVEALSERRRAA